MDPTPPPQPAPTRAGVWPWLVAAATLGIFLVANVIYADVKVDLVWTAMFSSIIVAFVLVGALLAARVPGNPIGPVILWSGALLATTVAIGTVADVAAERGDVPDWIVGAGLLINELGFIVPIVVILVGIPLIFPDGRLLSPRWRWFLVLCVSAVVALAISQIFGTGPIGPMEDIPNPFAIPALEPVTAVLEGYASWTSIIGFVGAMLSVVVRYRRGNEIERHQLKWLVAVSGVAAVALPLANVLPTSFYADFFFVIGLLALLALPLAIAVAILRYRLYDIDRIISRTIGWTLVSGLLVGAFAILVVGLQAVLSGVTQGETLAVAASTLIAFALFQPVRRTVQHAVDRRFDRARYDAKRTADAFAERLRDEVDLDTLAAELEQTVRGAIRPTAASIWLPERQT
jgi:hypothetical protein